MVYISSHNRNIWPGYVKPEKDELFSSWVVRTSYEHLLKVQTFCKLGFNFPQFWSRDVDRSAQQKFTDILLERTPLKENEINSLFLTKYQGKLYSNVSANSYSKWIIPSGIFHRTRKRRPLLFCPICLNEEKPYYRTQWRLSLSFICPRCKVFLLENCPFCKAPILFFRLELGRKNDFPEHKINVCYNCKKKLSDVVSRKAPDHLIKIQEGLFKTLDFEHSTDQITPTSSYFDVLYSLASLFISDANFSVKYRESIFKEFGLISTDKNEYKYLGFCNIENRTNALCVGHSLLENWPDSFISFCIRNKLGSSVFLREKIECYPQWYVEEIKRHIYSPI